MGDAIFADADGDKYSYTLEGADEPDDSSPSTPAPSTPQPPVTEAPEEPEQSETTEEPEVPEETEEPESEAEGVFTDVSGHWAESYINEAAGLGLIKRHGRRHIRAGQHNDPRTVCDDTLAQPGLPGAFGSRELFRPWL